MKFRKPALIVTAFIAATLNPIAAQTYTTDTAETPTTLRMRVEHMQTRYTNAVTELTGTFGRVSADPNLISSKEVVEAIDQGDRALKNTKATCGSILKTLKTKAKSIESEPSFTDDQKAELLAAVESMIAKTEKVSAQCVHTIGHLEGAYKAMAKWRTIHRTYLDLDGEEKARAQLKASVDEFLEGLTSNPDAFDLGTSKEPEVQGGEEKPE